MATLKHISSKNADYSAAERYLLFQHDEFTGKPILDENGAMMLREDYRISTLNCHGEDFAVACMRANLYYGKNRKPEDIKSHHYIISFDPRDGPDHGLTLGRAQELGEQFCQEHFPGHQALVCTHPDGHNHSGNIHVHIVINSLRITEVDRKSYMDRQCDTQAGAKHRCTAAALRCFRAGVMEMCQNAGLYQVNLLDGSGERITEGEYWAQRRGQTTLDGEDVVKGKPPTKFETDKSKLRQTIREVLAVATSFDEFASLLAHQGITVRKSRGRLSYLTQGRVKPIAARRLGDDFDCTAVDAVLKKNSICLRTGTGAEKSSIRSQLQQKMGVQRMVDIEAERAKGKGIGYEHWAKIHNLKQAAKSLNLCQQYGFSSLEELDAAITDSYTDMQESLDKMKSIETALREKKELLRYLLVYRQTKSVRDGLKAATARAVSRRIQESELLRSDAAIQFLKAHGVTKLPAIKTLQAETEALVSEKSALYSTYQEQKRRSRELLVVKRNLEQVLYGVPSQKHEIER